MLSVTVKQLLAAVIRRAVLMLEATLKRTSFCAIAPKTAVIDKRGVMTTQQRRDAILAAIKDSTTDCAKQLAQTYHVSRQTLGDIALIRAQGVNIIVTVSGYYYQTTTQQITGYRAQLVCQHTQAKTR